MKRALFILLLALLCLPVFAQGNDCRKKAEGFTRAAEYYQNLADDYLKEMVRCWSRAAAFERKAAQYLEKGDTVRAQIQQRNAEEAFGKADSLLRYYTEAERNAAKYAHWAADTLRYN